MTGIAFGHFYLGTAFVLYDVCPEVVGGKRRYVASLSGDPRVRVAADDPLVAATRLEGYVRNAARASAIRAA